MSLDLLSSVSLGPFCSSFLLVPFQEQGQFWHSRLSSDAWGGGEGQGRKAALSGRQSCHGGAGLAFKQEKRVLSPDLSSFWAQFAARLDCSKKVGKAGHENSGWQVQPSLGLLWSDWH